MKVSEAVSDRLMMHDLPFMSSCKSAPSLQSEGEGQDTEFLCKWSATGPVFISSGIWHQSCVLYFYRKPCVCLHVVADGSFCVVGLSQAAIGTEFRPK